MQPEILDHSFNASFKGTSATIKLTSKQERIANAILPWKQFFFLKRTMTKTSYEFASYSEEVEFINSSGLKLGVTRQ